MKNFAAKLLRWNNDGTGTQTKHIYAAKRQQMNRHILLGVLLLSGSLMLIAARPSFAQVKPDTYVSISPIVKETHLIKGTVEKILVTVGNQSTFPPPADVHYTAFLRVLNHADQLVCHSSAFYDSLPPLSSLQALQFQVAHPSPITQVGPSQTAQPIGPPRAEGGPISKHVPYRILITLSPTKPCPQADINCNNNSLNSTIQFLAGGTPSCIKLQ